MSNVLDDTTQQQILALGRLGWSLRRIEHALAVRRETISGYLKAAGIAVHGRAAVGANQNQNRPLLERCPPTSSPNRPLRPRGCPPTPCGRHRRAGPRVPAPASRDGVPGVRRILGVLALAKEHGPAVVEDAAKAALEIGVPPTASSASTANAGRPCP
jgi:hypothetical protein